MHKGFAGAAFTLWLALILLGAPTLYLWPYIDHQLLHSIPLVATGWVRSAVELSILIAVLLLAIVATDLVSRRRQVPFQFLQDEKKKADKPSGRSVASFLVSLATMLFGAATFVVLREVAGLFLPLLEMVYDKGRAEFADGVGLCITVVLLTGIAGNALAGWFLKDPSQRE